MNEALLPKIPQSDRKEILVSILKLSYLPILGQFFHPIYTIINVATCSRISDEALAAFGLGSLTLGIMLISVGVCFS
jgi:Na+-driven multidrug efflux pump